MPLWVVLRLGLIVIYAELECRYSDWRRHQAANGYVHSIDRVLFGLQSPKLDIVIIQRSSLVWCLRGSTDGGEAIGRVFIMLSRR